MHRRCSIEEDIVLLNINRTHSIEEICRDLARPREAIEARLEYLKDKEVVSGIDGEMVLKSKRNPWSAEANTRATAAQQEVMERSTYRQII